MTNYWKECISVAADECNLILTGEQLECLADSVEGGHENYGMAFGHDCIPNPESTEVEKLKNEIKQLKEYHEKQLSGVREGVAQRRGVSVCDVHIDEIGHVTYDRR